MFNLMDQGKHVVLGSYTFTRSDLLVTVGTKITENCYKIDKFNEFNEQAYIDEIISDVDKLPSHFFECVKQTKEEYLQTCINQHSEKQSCYFPEFRLVQEVLAHGIDVSVYCFLGNEGIKQLTDDYNRVIELENIDTVILVDGGMDSLMTGQEKDLTGKPMLGTPFDGFFL